MAYYRQSLARVHHAGYGFHADACAPGILKLLEQVRQRGGLVHEVGCGSGLLTRHLVDAGHRVLATDASEEMLSIARQYAPAAEYRRLKLPDDPVPAADAVVSTGHVLSYLPDESSIDRALVDLTHGLRPDGVLAIDLLDHDYGRARLEAPPRVQRTDDWAILTTFSQPDAGRFVREITTFVHEDDDTWSRDDERHQNVLVDTSKARALLADHGVAAEVRPSFGAETLPVGLVAIVGRKPV
jgi:SAM-dependent methyltransferase